MPSCFDGHSSCSFFLQSCISWHIQPQVCLVHSSNVHCPVFVEVLKVPNLLDIGCNLTSQLVRQSLCHSCPSSHASYHKSSEPAGTGSKLWPSGWLEWSFLASFITIFVVTRCLISCRYLIHWGTKQSSTSFAGLHPAPSSLCLVLGIPRSLSSLTIDSQTRFGSTLNFLDAARRDVSFTALITCSLKCTV